MRKRGRAVQDRPIQKTMAFTSRDRMKVRSVLATDATVWEAMRRRLWPDGINDHAPEIASFFAGTLQEPNAVLVAENATGVVVGFAEISIRYNAGRLQGKRVGYVEGLYVAPEARFEGVARGLLQASREWARQQECIAFASDRSGRIVIDKRF